MFTHTTCFVLQLEMKWKRLCEKLSQNLIMPNTAQ
ncbi:MAG: hypothetical protein HRT73_00355 [Flavobacteriales bacterium]|nr:hypothetical protein [Flavobacteriales bacterium]